MIALGFVLIYKATEMVNFAQGDLMMLGAFFAYSYINVFELPFYLAFTATISTMAIIGALTERLLIRPMIGEPHFSVLMLTIGLGFILRAVAGAFWGNEPRSLSTPYAGGVIDLSGLIIGYENLVIILGTVALCLMLYLFLSSSSKTLSTRFRERSRLQTN